MYVISILSKFELELLVMASQCYGHFGPVEIMLFQKS